MYAVLQMILVSIYFLISYQNKNVDIVINDRELGYCIEINAENFSNVKGTFVVSELCIIHYLCLLHRHNQKLFRRKYTQLILIHLAHTNWHSTLMMAGKL